MEGAVAGTALTLTQMVMALKIGALRGYRLFKEDARSRTTKQTCFCVSSLHPQEMEPLANPGRFTGQSHGAGYWISMR